MLTTTFTIIMKIKSEITDLYAKLEKVNKAISERRVEEIKVLADGYAKKLQMNGYSIEEGMHALKPYLLAGKAKAEIKFRNPMNATETWIGIGKQPRWFKEQLAAGRMREEMKV